MKEPPLLNFKTIFFDLFLHFSVVSILAISIYYRSLNLSYVFACICGGALIDADHFFDYFMFFKNKFEFKDFITCAYLRSGKVYVFLHSWELNLFLFILAGVIKSKWLFIFSLSLFLHLFVDNLQRKNRLFYFLSYRIIKKFDTKILLPNLDIG